MKTFMLYLGLLLSLSAASVFGKERPGYERDGIVDEHSVESIVLSDQSYKVSKLVNCFDLNGKRLVTCASLKPGMWVRATLKGDYPGVVTKIQAIRESEARMP